MFKKNNMASSSANKKYVLVEFKHAGEFDYVPSKWITNLNFQKIDMKMTYKTWWHADKNSVSPTFENDQRISEKDDSVRVNNTYYRVYLLEFFCKYH